MPPKGPSKAELNNVVKMFTPKAQKEKITPLYNDVKSVEEAMAVYTKKQFIQYMLHTQEIKPEYKKIHKIDVDDPLAVGLKRLAVGLKRPRKTTGTRLTVDKDNGDSEDDDDADEDEFEDLEDFNNDEDDRPETAVQRRRRIEVFQKNVRQKIRSRGSVLAECLTLNWAYTSNSNIIDKIKKHIQELMTSWQVEKKFVFEQWRRHNLDEVINREFATISNIIKLPEKKKFMELAGNTDWFQLNVALIVAFIMAEFPNRRIDALSTEIQEKATSTLSDKNDCMKESFWITLYDNEVIRHNAFANKPRFVPAGQKAPGKDKDGDQEEKSKNGEPKPQPKTSKFPFNGSKPPYHRRR